MAEAKRLCPKMEFVGGNHKYYVRCSVQFNLPHLPQGPDRSFYAVVLVGEGKSAHLLGLETTGWTAPYLLVLVEAVAQSKGSPVVALRRFQPDSLAPCEPGTGDIGSFPAAHMNAR